MLKKTLLLVAILALLSISASIAYYFFVFLPDTHKEDRQAQLRQSCANQVNQQEDEIREMTNYDPFVDDRGCFLEAGCMQGVTDPVFEAKFDACNMGYYDECMDGVKKESEDRFEEEKQKRIQTCIDEDYSI